MNRRVTAPLSAILALTLLASTPAQADVVFGRVALNAVEVIARFASSPVMIVFDLASTVYALVTD